MDAARKRFSVIPAPAPPELSRRLDHFVARPCLFLTTSNQPGSLFETPQRTHKSHTPSPAPSSGCDLNPGSPFVCPACMAFGPLPSVDPSHKATPCLSPELGAVATAGFMIAPHAVHSSMKVTVYPSHKDVTSVSVSVVSVCTSVLRSSHSLFAVLSTSHDIWMCCKQRQGQLSKLFSPLSDLLE